ncbi:hypothetical protein GCM10018773_63890 [Streptomyces candidus]|nr:hypothetical protein GCM10018773_63890 [Streptomyces candidus]
MLPTEVPETTSSAWAEEPAEGTTAPAATASFPPGLSFARLWSAAVTEPLRIPVTAHRPGRLLRDLDLLAGWTDLVCWFRQDSESLARDTYPVRPVHGAHEAGGRRTSPEDLQSLTKAAELCERASKAEIPVRAKINPRPADQGAPEGGNRSLTRGALGFLNEPLWAKEGGPSPHGGDRAHTARLRHREKRQRHWLPPPDS